MLSTKLSTGYTPPPPTRSLSASYDGKKFILNKKWVTIILTVFVFLLHIPLILQPTWNLDPSWQLGLQWADLKGLSFGSDIAFTYGPLGFLFYGPINLGQNSHVSLLFEYLFYSFIQLIVILMFVCQFVNLVYTKSWKNFSTIEQVLIVLGLSLLAFFPLGLPNYLLVLTCILFIRVIFDIELNKANRKRLLLNILAIAVILDIVCLIKFSYTIVAFTLLCVAIIGLVYRKKAVLIAYIVTVFIFFNIIFWLCCGQPLSALSDYYAYGFEVSFGYTEAMQYPTLFFSLAFVCGIFAFPIMAFIVCLALMFFFVKKDFYQTFLFIIIFPIAFMAFKDSFVGGTPRSVLFYTEVIPIILVFILFFINVQVLHYRKTVKLFSLFVIAIIMVVIRAENSQYEIDHTLGSLLMVDDTQARRNKQLIRAEYDSLPPAFLDNAKDKTIDIIPWDIALLWAYDLNWTPRPVIQSYSAYTPMLDSINAQHFKDSKAPDNIIYSYKSIPGRYPLFDEPMVFRTLLENYDVQTVDDYLILQHRLEKITRHYTPVNQGVCPVGTVVDVPQLPGQHIYCNIDIRQNFFGKLINILYKPGYIYIRFFVKGQSEPIEYRFIRRLGTDGLFVSKYVADLTDICSVFEESYEQDIEKLQIVIPHNLFYKPDMKYEFYATPIL